MTGEIVIPVEVRNPGAFLAACGIAEIVGMFDPVAVSCWERRPVQFGMTKFVASACVLKTAIPEHELAASLFDALSCAERWDGISLDGRHTPLHQLRKDEPVVTVRVDVHLSGRREFFPIDYWYHQLAR